MNLFRVSALVAGFALGGGICAANAGTYDYGSYGFSGGYVHFSDAALGINDDYGGAGLIRLYGSPIMSAYCVDIADWLAGSGSYNLGVDPATNPNLTGLSSFTGNAKIADISALIFNGGDSAAVQLAIWETEYGAAAAFTPDDPGLSAVAQTYLGYLNTVWHAPATLSLFELTPADGQANQTLVYLGDPPAHIPEPATLPLLVGGAFLIGLVAKRREPAEAIARC